MNHIKLNIKGISYSQTQVGAYALILEEEIGNRKLPIIIGSFEAQAIAIALEKDLKYNRPLTHDLFVSFARAFHIDIDSVLIYKLEDGVFYAQISAKNKEGLSINVDARTSDSIALAVRYNAPIYARKEVLDKAGIYLDMIDEDEDENVNKAIQAIEEELNSLVETDEDNYLEDFSIPELDTMLQEAIENEDYEKAAQLRDEIDKRKF